MEGIYLNQELFELNLILIIEYFQCFLKSNLKLDQVLIYQLILR